MGLKGADLNVLDLKENDKNKEIKTLKNAQIQQKESHFQLKKWKLEAH